jgi:hypothetical protein
MMVCARDTMAAKPGVLSGLARVFRKNYLGKS